MIFNELSFILFFLFSLLGSWWLNKNHIQARNLFLLLVSYIFYASWDYRFCILLFVSTCIDYFFGHKIYNAKTKLSKKRFLRIAICLNLLMLFTFKYCNFFVDSASTFLTNLGLLSNPYMLNIFLPVGISFYTFQSMSYSLDIHKGKLKPSNNFFNFAVYVSFFPQLLAGPIEKAKNFLPQFDVKRTITPIEIKNAFRQILWGFFMKLGVADNIAPYVDQVFSEPSNFDSLSLFVGSLLFSLQLYGDFAGYSHLAIGLAALLGFQLSQNFNYPFFSKTVVEAWQRWHISLTSWIGVYVFRPLLFRLKGIRNIMMRDIVSINILFFLTALWHGPKITFLVWGFIHATVYIIDSNRKSYFIKPIWLRVIMTFIALSISNIVFRTESLSHLVEYYQHLASFNFSQQVIDVIPRLDFVLLSIYIFILIVIEYLGQRNDHPLKNIKWHFSLRWSAYLILTLIVIDNFVKRETFIYFQF